MSRKNGRCIDCEAEWERRGGRPKVWRRAPNPGPRCASHDRQKRRLSKASAHETRVQKVYGLSPGDYERMYLHQGGVCAICQRANGATRRLSVDHNHKSGLARMLVCRPCNDMLGHGRDDPAFFRRAADLLEQTPAWELGIIAVHEDFRKDENDGS